MPASINSNYSANFQKFVDFANKAYATKGEDTVARFSGMPKGDYKGTFASILRSGTMKTANDSVRDLFRKTIADMFGGEKFIPDLVRDNMKLEDFGKGKPLTARRIKLVATAINMLGGGKFMDSASISRATSMGYAPAELTKLARAATIYQQATGCTDAEAEAAALDPNSKARRLFDCGGRFTLNAENFKKGLVLMDKFAGWYENLHDDFEANKLDTPTKRNFMSGIANRQAGKGVLKFLMEEIAVNPKIPLDAKNPEDAFGMAKNPAMRFVGRNYTQSFANSLAQIPPAKRSVLYAVFDAYHKLPSGDKMPDKSAEIGQNTILAARVMKHFDAVAALQSAGKLDRAHLTPLLYSELQVSPNASNKEISDAYETKLMSDVGVAMQLHELASQTGATLDEAAEAIRTGASLKSAPWITLANGHLADLDGTANGGREQMVGDLYRPTAPKIKGTEEDAIPAENAKFVFNFPGGEKVTAKAGDPNSEDVQDSNNAIADKIKDLCGEVHQAQLSNVYYALSQSGTGDTKKAFEQYGIYSDEHMPVTFTLSRNDETGAVTIKYSEPEGMPLKFNWTTTVEVDGTSTSTPMRIDHGQYEAKALKSAKNLAKYMPGKDAAAAEALIKDMLSHCGDDFELKDIVSQAVHGLCITGDAKVRTLDQIKERIDAVRANLDEVRKAAAGNEAIEKAGVYFLSGMNGKSLPTGLIAKIIKSASAEKPGDFVRLSATSTPLQIAKAIADMNAAVDNTLRASDVLDYLEGSDEMDTVREFAFSLIIANVPKEQLQAANAALRSETTSKLFSVLDDLENRRYRADETQVPRQLRAWVSEESRLIVGQGTRYNMSLERLLGKGDNGIIRDFRGQFDKLAFGMPDILDMLVPLAKKDSELEAAKKKSDALVNSAAQVAKTKAVNAYSKAGEGNAAKVDKLIKIALKHCSANEDAVNIVAKNIDTMLVSANAQLRSIEKVRELSKAVAANFAELTELSKDNPAIYEAGKRLMTGMEGKALPPGMIAKLVVEASNAKIDAIRRLSPRSSGLDIHRAVTEFSDNLARAMKLSGADEALAGAGANEKQACRNFFAAAMLSRCSASTLRAMQGAFVGDTPAKMLALYADIADGHQNEDLEREIAIKFENEAAVHMMNIANLKGAIDVLADGKFGADIEPFRGPFDAGEFGGSEMLEDLLNRVSQ